MKFVKVIKAEEFEKENVKEELQTILKKIEQEKDLFMSEIVYLQDHKDDIKKLFPNEQLLWQWADIPEEEWNKGASLKKKAYDDSEEDLDSFDYTYSLLVNGNITNYKEKLNKMTKKELVNYINWANEMGIDISKLSLRYITANKKVSKIVSKKSIKSAENYGWVVESKDAFDKLQLFIDTFGAETAVNELARAMGNNELAENLAYIFRQYDFRQGRSDYESEEEENK